MLEIHRLRHVHWLPTAIVALATSPDGTAVAAARESGAIELWKAAPGSVGWYCQLTIPGMRGAATSCLIWCTSASSPHGRLFSSGLDGLITEWDLQKLETKAQVESFGGSVWQIAARPVQSSSASRKSGEKAKAKDEESSDSDSDIEDEAGPPVSKEQQQQQQEIAVACDDGSVRLFTVNEGADGLTYKKAFPPVKGRILSVAWSSDGTRVFAGGSDGCIRCWDPARSYELYRITAGIGGSQKNEELCVWSLLALKCGTLVSGDSTGSTQFWDQRGTLLEALRHHKADVLALAAAPSQEAVFAAGADGQVILYKVVRQSRRLKDARPDVSTGLGDKWTYIGSKRAHSHDVRALTVAVPLPFDEGDPSSRPWVRPYKQRSKWPEPDHRKWARPGIPMVVSGGNDAKLFAYPANEMMSYQPHDICPAPERTLIQQAPGLATDGNVVMMAQHSTYIDVWRVASSSLSSSSATENGSLGKRKRDDAEALSNGEVKHDNVHPVELPRRKADVGTKSGHRPVLLAKVKTKAAGHISCSAFSGNGRYLAFSDRSKPRLFELEHGQKQWIIKKKRLRSTIPAAHQMIFSVDSTKLILACAQSEILVFDIEASEILHVFKLATTSSDFVHSPVTLLSASPDGQWLAAGTSTGNLIILNLETLRHHWSVPLIDGTPATAACFHSGSNAVLIVTTAANKIHVLDIEARELGMWSKVNQSNIPSEILEFPGGISGLTVCPSTKATEIIAYSSRAMCLIDFSKPVEQQEQTKQKANGHLQNGHGHAKSNGRQQQTKKNFVLSPFKNPVLFVKYLSEKSVLIVERPWLEVLHQLPAPVFRHRYGT